MSSTTIATTEKPLNQTQLRNLQELVAGDFSDLSRESLAMINQRASRRKEAIIKSYDDTTKREAEMNEAITRYCEEEQARINAVVLKMIEESGGASTTERPVTVAMRQPAKIANDMAAELTALDNATGRLREQSNIVIARERRAIERSILLQGIVASAAQTIINDLPKIEDVLGLVAESTAATHADDIRIVLGLEPGDELPTMRKELES